MIFKYNYLHFLLLVLVIFLLTYEYNYFIQTDEIYVQDFSDKYTQEAINHILNLRHTWSWVGYIFVPISTYFSITIIAWVISLVIWISYLNEINPEIKFSDIWRIVLFAQWSNVAAMFAKIFWFGFIHTDYTLEELASFFPLSIINFFDISILDNLYIYPIQLVNMFEFVYWIVLVIGIKNLLNHSWLKSLKIVFLSYGVTMIVWIIIVMFITLNLSN